MYEPTMDMAWTWSTNATSCTFQNRHRTRRRRARHTMLLATIASHRIAAHQIAYNSPAPSTRHCPPNKHCSPGRTMLTHLPPCSHVMCRTKISCRIRSMTKSLSVARGKTVRATSPMPAIVTVALPTITSCLYSVSRSPSPPTTNNPPQAACTPSPSPAHHHRQQPTTPHPTSHYPPPQSGRHTFMGSMRVTLKVAEGGSRPRMAPSGRRTSATCQIALGPHRFSYTKAPLTRPLTLFMRLSR